MVAQLLNTLKKIERLEKMIGKKSVFVIAALLSIIALLIPFAFSYRAYASPAVQVEILSYSDYYDSLGWLHIVGEVKNSLDSRVRFVKIIATYYDSGGTRLLTPPSLTHL